MAIFKKNKKEQLPQLNIEDASKILENVFRENQMAPNTVPLEVLTAYSNYRRERFSLQRMILLIIMVLFLMLPFLFIPSTFTLKRNVSADAPNPTYTLEVTSKMLVDRVTASIDGRNVPVYEVDSHVYSIEPALNGTMTVTVTLMNRQTCTKTVEVQHVDLETPIVVSNDFRDGQIYLYLSDTGSGVDYENIYATDLSGHIIHPVSYDKASGCVVFSYPEETLNVFIPDYAKNKLQLVISLR